MEEGTLKLLWSISADHFINHEPLISAEFLLPLYYSVTLSFFKAFTFLKKELHKIENVGENCNEDNL